MTVDDLHYDPDRMSLRGEWIDGKYHCGTWEMWHLLANRKPKGELTVELVREWQRARFKGLTGRDR